MFCHQNRRRSRLLWPIKGRSSKQVITLITKAISSVFLSLYCFLFILKITFGQRRRQPYTNLKMSHSYGKKIGQITLWNIPVRVWFRLYDGVQRSYATCMRRELPATDGHTRRFTGALFHCFFIIDSWWCSCCYDGWLCVPICLLLIFEYVRHSE